jgi:ubiquitin-like modifier-activating enzyme ATG7
MSSSILQFAPFASSLTPDFWTAFTTLKIDALKLSESPVPLRGHYGPGKAIFDRESGLQLSLGASVHFDSNAFDQRASRDNE